MMLGKKFTIRIAYRNGHGGHITQFWACFGANFITGCNFCTCDIWSSVLDTAIASGIQNHNRRYFEDKISCRCDDVVSHQVKSRHCSGVYFRAQVVNGIRLFGDDNGETIQRGFASADYAFYRVNTRFGIVQLDNSTLCRRHKGLWGRSICIQHPQPGFSRTIQYHRRGNRLLHPN